MTSFAGQTQEPVETPRNPVRLSRLWLRLSLTAALLAGAGSVAGLAAPGVIYDQETVALADSSTAQDIVNLFLVAPLMAGLAVWASRGSLRAYLCWFGFVAFTVYNYVIYTFSIHFGPLFLIWVAVLGLSLFALIGGLTTLDTASVKARFGARSAPLQAWFLIAVAALFALLWLSEIVPDLLVGDPSTSASDMNVPTNPVHVLDLAFFLPAALVSGVLVLRRHPLGYATVAGQLSWVALICLPILVTPLVANSRGHQPGWTVMVPVGFLFVLTLTVLVLLLRRQGPPGHGA
ncbi:hypothetical protein AB0L70_35700 [Kribbella sp. NPDC051952]|uniref:hypothetical protein n=1 Tax=Kribbella sp. NPDC051952 TaxID=3154851 RepID=UPI003444BEBA